jgi:sugar-specific transcriptional regulator TrmB
MKRPKNVIEKIRNKSMQDKLEKSSQLIELPEDSASGTSRHWNTARTPQPNTI